MELFRCDSCGYAFTIYEQLERHIQNTKKCKELYGPSFNMNIEEFKGINNESSNSLEEKSFG